MTRPLPLSPLLFALSACGTSSTVTPAPVPTPPVDQAVAATEEAPAATGYSVSPDFARVARDTPSTQKFEFHIDKSGKITKQAVYHADASAIPEPVAKLAEEKFPGAKATNYEYELYEDGGEIFEVEVTTKDGKKCEVAAKGDGTLVYVECEFKPKKLAEPIAKKIKELYPKGKITEAETKQGPGIDLVTVEVEEGDKEFYLHFSPEGEIKAQFRKIPGEIELEL